MPWLHGFSAAAAADAEQTSNRIDDLDDSRYGGLAVRARVGEDPAATVVASIRGGVAVRDASGRTIARRPGFDESGTADDLAELAVGDAELGAPVIAIARTLGGHRESTTSLALYQLGAGGLDVLFDQPVVERTGDDDATGAVIMLPGALIYRAPAGQLSLWCFDRGARRYVRVIQLAPAVPVGVETEPSRV